MDSEQCECRDWARMDNWRGVESLIHHQNCEKFNPIQEAKEILVRLTRGIEAWASDEDGVHPDIWDAYRDALWFTLQFEKWNKTSSEEPA